MVALDLFLVSIVFDMDALYDHNIDDLNYPGLLGDCLIYRQGMKNEQASVNSISQKRGVIGMPGMDWMKAY